MKEVEVNVHEAKTHLSRLLQRVANGEEITIANRGVAVARLVPVVPRGRNRPLGIDDGRIRIADDFDAPLADSVLHGFPGNSRRRKRAR
jgi:prevent-host-death family protein